MTFFSCYYFSAALHIEKKSTTGTTDTMKFVFPTSVYPYIVRLNIASILVTLFLIAHFCVHPLTHASIHLNPFPCTFIHPFDLFLQGLVEKLYQNCRKFDNYCFKAVKAAFLLRMYLCLSLYLFFFRFGQFRLTDITFIRFIHLPPPPLVLLSSTSNRENVTKE